jgi:hypothetical protein
VAFSCKYSLVGYGDYYTLLFLMSTTLVNVFSLYSNCNKYQIYFYFYLFKLLFN